MVTLQYIINVLKVLALAKKMTSITIYKNNVTSINIYKNHYNKYQHICNKNMKSINIYKSHYNKCQHMQ